MTSMPNKWVLASDNQGKIKELKALLAPFGIHIVTQGELGVSAVPETGLTFVENALIKARHAASETGLPALADDSGLVVSALSGEPGIYSARYAGEPKDDQRNNDKLLQALAGKTQRDARFVCVLALCWHANHPLPVIAQGLWQGEIATEATGEAGFGYDPIFYLPALQCTAAQLTADEKNRYSHRAKALAQLKLALTDLSENGNDR